MRKGESSEAGRLIVDEKSIKSSVEHIAGNGAKPNTQKQYEHDVKMFANFLDIRKVSRKILDDYKTAKFEEYSIVTVKTMLYEASAVENKVKKIAANCGIFELNFAAIRDTFGARCAENNLDMKTLGEIMGSNNVEIYYPDIGASESPLEFLREAY